MRMTRAALRAQAHDDNSQQQIHEDSEVVEFGGDHETAERNSDQGSLGRRALKDITREINPNYNTDDVFVEEQPIPLKKAAGKNKEKHQKREAVQETVEHNQVSVTDHTNLNVHDSPALDAELDNSSHSVAKDTIDQESFIASQEDVLERSYTEPLETPQTVNFDTASPLPQLKSSAPKTPKFDPTIHLSESNNEALAPDTVEDSFIDNIKTRSPSKMRDYSASASMSPESFVDRMPTRTPRIEDSVEAIDALEDAIEKISEGLPVLDGLKINSPIKSAKKTPARLNLEPASKTSSTLRRSERTPARNPRNSPTKIAPSKQNPTSIRARPSSYHPAISKPTAKAPIVTKNPSRSISPNSKSTQSTTLPPPPALSFSNSPPKALPNTTKKRVPSTSLSTSKPGFVPARSTKPPTKSTFSLPGEVISAKLKAQREEKLKREEEAEKAKKLFKARPLPSKTAEPSVKPRENKASQARLSIYAGGFNKENIEPQKVSSVDRKPRPLSMINIKPKPDVTKANSGVRRTTSVVDRSTVSKPRVSSLQLSAGQKSTVSREDTIRQKATGKEVFARSKSEIERMEKERKEKEAATRKARAEAAERGRQASREWAEKQKKRLTLQATAKLPGTNLDGGSSTAVSTSS